MNAILGIIMFFIFIAISGLHFYWVLGGQKGLDRVLPTNEKGIRVINPGKLETFLVSIGLLFFAFYYLFKAGLIQFNLPKLIIDYSGWIILSIFILRAIGEFKYVGFFKKIKHTDFGTYDTKYYSPLCLIIGLIGILLEVF